MECTPGAVRAGAKFEETREVVEEPLTMSSLSVDMEHALRGWMLWRAAAVPCACALHELPKVLVGCFETCFEDPQNKNKQKQTKRLSLA